jgi:hypothetical protein
LLRREHLAYSMHAPALSGRWVRERLVFLYAHVRNGSMGNEGRVSLTNLCGQLVVTGIPRDAIKITSPRAYADGTSEDRALPTHPTPLCRR